MYYLDMNKISIIPIGSGSTGNCFFIEIGKYSLLIDMGIGYRKVKEALEFSGKDICQINAIFLTHGHYDHVKAASPISNNTFCKVYADQSSMYSICKIKSERIILNIDETVEVLPGLKVRMFSLPLDFVRTCGYTFEYEDRKLGFVTDCGKMNKNIIEELKGCDPIIIESNHDVEMLKNGPYPKELQKRIMSKYGHLSNEECADTIYELYKHGTRNFLLAHISLKNNTPDLALKAVKDRMKDKEISLYACPFEGKDLLKY